MAPQTLTQNDDQTPLPTSTPVISTSTISTDATLTVIAIVTESTVTAGEPPRPQIVTQTLTSSNTRIDSVTTVWAATTTSFQTKSSEAAPTEEAPTEAVPTQAAPTKSTAVPSKSSESIATPPAATASADSGNNPPLPSTSSGLATGAIVGIAVGAVAIVAIIAGFFIWKFCLSKRRSRKGTAPYGEARVGTPGTSNPNSIEKGAPLVGAIAPLYRDSDSPEGHTLLPQQADDATVQSRFSTLYDQIELHAENFYKDASPMIPPAIEGALSRYDTPLLGAPLAARLEESPRATTILKHVLSYEISTTVVDPTSGDRKRSLLPTPLLALLQEAQSQQAGRRGVQTSAYSRLKQLAASYRTSPQSMPTTTSSATRESALHFTQVFSLWADPQYDEARRTQHLTEVIDSAIKFSVWLLSQPETFELRWDGAASSTGSNSSNVDKETTGSLVAEHTLITVPALVKVTSSSGGNRLSRNSENVLCKPVRRPI